MTKEVIIDTYPRILEKIQKIEFKELLYDDFFKGLIRILFFWHVPPYVFCFFLDFFEVENTMQLLKNSEDRQHLVIRIMTSTEI